MSVTGPPGEPTRVGLPIGDLLAGMYGAFGVLAALLDRERTGRGTVVRTSLLAAIVGVHSFQGTRWTVAHQVPEGPGNHHPSIAPYGLFHAADGPIQIAVGSEAQWRVLAPIGGCGPGRSPLRDQPRPGGPPRIPAGDDRLCPRRGIQRYVARATGRPRHSRGSGSLARPGVRLGADPVAGFGDHRRSSGPGSHRPARATAAIRRSSPFAGGRETHLPPPALGQHDDEVRVWLAGPSDVNVLAESRSASTDCFGGQRDDGARGSGAAGGPDRRHRHGCRTGSPRSSPTGTTS